MTAFDGAAVLGSLLILAVAPQSHRIHHSVDPRHHAKNFGVVFSFWDRLMGTQWHDHTEYPDTGIPDLAFPTEESTTPVGVMRDYVRQLVYPFRAIWNASRGRGWEIERSATPREPSDRTSAPSA